ncbi:Aldolase-type TIM barrel [Moorella glycerini]|uniref:2-oxoglutarate carboxylase large subunit n=1 Tax=Neomoorella stamsii TaxID=1266720 RepID=A0A9X7J338_9FIRM|nr:MULTISPECIES: acetyl-CoA carboxylase biotin carboxyl carrier protein [Moorella]PRR71851.1 2-oxoglutarate carboxylase large subunit [Moorella stamsii]CEP66069.1 Aldolase-type TIM barrel [Moorella glycerini]
MSKLKITDTTLRDGHQSLWATRMTTADMLPIIEKIDSVGYHSLEVWGGATFDVCMRFLDEDPWERLRTLKKYARKTPLQMLLRAQSLVGYQLYPDDVVRAFIARAVANGIDIIRIFDALNDLRNMEVPIAAAKKEGAHVQGTVVYTISPVHTTEHYLQTALELESMGVDSICIKDMAGLLAPFEAYELVKLFKEKLHVPVQLHSHYIGGLAVGAYLEAARAGVDVVDTASVPLAFGASQPPVETVVRALAGTPYDTGLDLNLLFEIARYFDDLRRELGYERGVTRITDMWVFQHQVPGGMISNLVSQLKEQKAADRINEVLAEIPRVRADLGYPPLVTPTSQIVGTQAVLNVLLGQRYKMVPGEVKNYVRGLYGRPPAPISEEIRRLIIGDEEPIQGRPADILPPRLEEARQEIGDLARNEEDVISYALFPQVARKFFEDRRAGRLQPGRRTLKPQAGVKAEAGGTKKMDLKDITQLIKALEETGITELNLESDGVKIMIRRGGDQGGTAGPAPAVQVTTDAKPETQGDKPLAQTPQDIVEVRAPMVGTFYRAPAPDAPPFVEVGTRVKPGQTLCIIEAMKLMNELTAETAGQVVRILAENGQPVEYGQVLFHLKKE